MALEQVLEFYGLILGELAPSDRLPGDRRIFNDPRLRPYAAGAYFVDLEDCVKAFYGGGSGYALGTAQAFTRKLDAARNIVARIARAVQHWDEFTAAREPYPLRKTHEYAVWVRRLAEWSAYTAVYAHTLEHLRAGRLEEALLPYARCHPRVFWDLFWEFAFYGKGHAIDWLGAHLVPQLLPLQEPFCRRALQALIDQPRAGACALDGEAMQAALLAVRFTVYPRRASLGAATLHDMRPGDFTPARDGPWRVFLPPS